MLKTAPFDAAKYLDNEESIAAYITEVLEDGDPALAAKAIGTVTRALDQLPPGRRAKIEQRTRRLLSNAVR